MSVAFVLGNGISRSNISPGDLHQCGRIYGCNALFRDYVPDVLVATDKPIAQHIESTGYPLTNKFYTRTPTEGLGAFAIPKPYYGFSSGPIAVALAAQDQHRRIYMIGFDMGPNSDNKFNNLYADTDFYKASGSHPTYTGNWVRQVQQICREYPDTKFIRATGTTTARLAELDSIKNMIHQPLEQLVEQLNTKRNF